MHARAPGWLVALNLAMLVILSMLVARTWFWDQGLPREQLLALRLVRQQIEEEYVTPPNGEDLAWSAIEGMVSSLDRHSQFIRPDFVEAFEEDTTGAYVGIGILMATDVAPVTVQFPFVGGPSERAGLRVGDQILAADGVPLVATAERSANAVAHENLTGPTGTKVVLKVQRAEAAPFEVVVERGRVQTPSVKWARLLAPQHGVGYLYLSSFQQRSAAEIRDAVADLRAQADNDLRALVVDLRYNLGGLLEQAVDVSNLFQAQGAIVSLKRRNAEVERRDADPERCAFPDLPLVLLVNEDSASASEVFAGAMQDHERAVLVGTRTFGKGLVQSIYRWEELSFRLKLTTAHYYTPSGRSIQRIGEPGHDGVRGGIEPDRVVRLDNKKERSDLKSLLQRGQDVPRRYSAEVKELSQRLDLTMTRPPGPESDAQLAAALEEALRQIGVAVEPPSSGGGG
ncbi:MAG: S41 family peptidase [Planctomycetota bacterium]